MLEDVVLKVELQKDVMHDNAGWKSVKISSSLDKLAHSFSLEMSARWPKQPENYRIKLGAKCQVFSGKEKILSGRIDQMSPSYSDSSHSISVSGRDLCGYLVDCSHVSEKVDFFDQDLVSIATEVCAPFGVAIEAEKEIPGKFKRASYSQGDSVHCFLLKLCKQRGVLPVSNGNGVLSLRISDKRPVIGELKVGKNIIEASGDYSGNERFSKYLVKGQAAEPEEDQEGETKSLSVVGEAEDPVLKDVHRPLIILADVTGNKAAMEARARWESVNRAGKSRRATFKVQGWRTAAGKLWQVNKLVKIDDSLLGMKGEYLIESVSFSLDESSGTTTELGVIHPDAYAVQPTKDQAKNIKNSYDGEQS